MSTEQRVHQFGTPDMVDQFESLELEDFQQEFETEFVDAIYSYYPYDLILPCTDHDYVMYDSYRDVPKPNGRLVAGFDVGRTRDRSELAVFEQKDGFYFARVLRSFKNAPFAEQEHELRELLDTLPVVRLSIDRSGLGMHLAENLEADYPQVKPEVFTTESKERWATNYKILLQKGKVILPGDRDLVAQTHSIKRHVLASGRVSFESEKGRSGHADRFWAVAMACQKEQETDYRGAIVTARVIGAKSDTRRFVDEWGDEWENEDDWKLI